jgi:hypothetical protein
MSLAIPSKEMVEQYQTALKEMSLYLEENYAELDDDFDESPQTLDDWLDEMKKDSSDSSEEEMDSDVDGMLMN